MNRVDDGWDMLFELAGGLFDLLGWLFEFFIELPDSLKEVYHFIRRNWERIVVAVSTGSSVALVLVNRLRGLRAGRQRPHSRRPGPLHRIRERTNHLAGAGALGRPLARVRRLNPAARQRRSSPHIRRRSVPSGHCR